MLGRLLARNLVSARLLCPHCQSSLFINMRHISESHYDVLGIEKSASQSEIRSAFLSLSKQLHPDMNNQDPTTHGKFIKLNEAYTILSKPISRREYDLNLAARIHLERQIRNSSSSYSYQSSAWPGSGSTHQYDADQQRFWDETIWHMRDKSKDKDFEGRPYYSYGKMKRVSNVFVVLGCMVFMSIGVLLHYVAIRKSRELHKAVLDEKDKIYHNTLAKARSDARTHGNALQLQILKSKAAKTRERVGISDQGLRDSDTEGRK